MTRIVSFVFIMAVSLIAVIIAVLGVLAASRKAAKAKKGIVVGEVEKDEAEWITCRYCGTERKSTEAKCGNCGASR